ncbi:hypothetical protein PINS_up006163 [Pythium insidiosum]|nr:hypothetical protein PINS_up006163 [Pythium insidiosum]
MQGGRSEPGIVALAVRDVFQHIAQRPEREFLLRFSYLEVYNERVFDLLANGTRPETIKLYEVDRPTTDRSGSNGSSGSGSGSGAQDVVVKGVVEEIVVSVEHLLSLVETGNAHRHTASTAANEQSSRSHTIFRLVIESQRASNNSSSKRSASASATSESPTVVRSSTLNLVDLAGSESVRLAHTTGQQQEEGRYINRSLLTLGHIIWKLSRGRASADSNANSKATTTTTTSETPLHLPYRNSKLTRLLQPALSGSAHIALVCTIAPSVECLAETHHTLKFASRARRVKSRLAVNDAAGESALLRKYRARLRELESQWKDIEQRRCDRLTAMAATAGRGAGAGAGGSSSHAELAVLDARQLELQFAIENINRVILNSSLRQTHAAEPLALALEPQDADDNSRAIVPVQRSLLSNRDNEVVGAGAGAGVVPFSPYGVPIIETSAPTSDGSSSNNSLRRANATLLSDDSSGKSSPYLRPRRTLMSVLKAKYVNELRRLEGREPIPVAEGDDERGAKEAPAIVSPHQPEDEDDLGGGTTMTTTQSRKELLREFVRGLETAEAENDTRLSQIYELEVENHHLRELLRQREDELERLRRRS